MLLNLHMPCLKTSMNFSEGFFISRSTTILQINHPGMWKRGCLTLCSFSDTCCLTILLVQPFPGGKSLLLIDVVSPETIPLFGCTKWANQKILDACLILSRDEDTDVYVVGTSVFTLNSPGPLSYSNKVRKTFSLVFRRIWFMSILLPKSILKIFSWYIISEYNICLLLLRSHTVNLSDITLMKKEGLQPARFLSAGVEIHWQCSTQRILLSTSKFIASWLMLKSLFFLFCFVFNPCALFQPWFCLIVHVVSTPSYPLLLLGLATLKWILCC